MTRSLRIVTPRYSAGVSGGTEALLRALATQLVARGWDVDVLTTTAADEATWASSLPGGRSEEDGVVVHRVPPRMRRRPRLFHQLSRVVFRLPARLRPESLWLAAQGPYAPGLVRRLRALPPGPTLFSPYLFHPVVRGITAAPHPRLLMPAAHDEPALRLRAVGAEVAAADGLWFHTPEERDLLVAVHPAASRLPIEVGTTGVEPGLAADPTAFAAGHGITGPYLLHGGRHVAGKGVDELVAMAAAMRVRVPGVEIVLAGGDAAALLGTPGVRAVGRLDDAAWHEAVAGAAAVVVPGALESLSLIALDAWSAGRPVLANSASPVLAAQLARSGGGVGWATTAEFVDAVAGIVADPAGAAAMGERGRGWVLATYRWDDVEARLVRLIEAAGR